MSDKVKVIKLIEDEGFELDIEKVEEKSEPGVLNECDTRKEEDDEEEQKVPKKP